MNRKWILTIFTIILIVSTEARKTSGRSRGSGSGRGTSRRTNYNPQPAPTSFSQTQAQKPTLFGWQEQPGQSSWQSKSSSGQSHSYPSSGTGSHTYPSGGSGSHSYPSGTGLSGNNKPKQPSSPNQQAGHSYPSSPGLSGSAGGGYPQQTGSKYPQQGTGTGQSGYPQSAQNYPQQHGVAGSGSAVAPPPYTPHQNNYGNQYHPQGPPPPYSNYGGSNYGGAGGHGYYNPGSGPQVPGYFGNYGKPSGGMSRGGSVLTGVGIAGAGIGTVLTGLALWNLARSTGHHHHTVVYDNRGQPVAVAPANDTSAAAADSILADLVNCSLAISNDDKTEVLAIPCSIATSFTPDANVKDSDVNKDPNDNTKCTIAVLTKTGKEYMTTIPCSILLNTAAENNVTEPPLVIDQPINNNNFTSEGDIQSGGTMIENVPKGEPTALRLSEDVNGDDKKLPELNCTVQPEEIRDPINPCFSINHNLTVIPLPTTEAPK